MGKYANRSRYSTKKNAERADFSRPGEGRTEQIRWAEKSQKGRRRTDTKGLDCVGRGGNRGLIGGEIGDPPGLRWGGRWLTTNSLTV